MFFTMCETRKDRELVIKYWEEMRKKAAEIRDSYDYANDNKFHRIFYERIRPDFMEPLPTRKKVNYRVYTPNVKYSCLQQN